MKRGLVLGKFLPLHKGHLALIDFAARRCQQLYVVICYTFSEPVPGTVRKQWLIDELNDYPSITVVAFEYNDQVLPNTSISSRDVSEKWAKAMNFLVGSIDIVFSSEAYGDYLAEYLNCVHLPFDIKRNAFPVAGSEIIKEPFRFWDAIPERVRPWFIKKVGIVGSESTGKSTLAETLALHYKTNFVPEMARSIIDKTTDVTFSDLTKIALVHAETIREKMAVANKLLFIDTDINITKSYASFLFSKKLIVPTWVEEANLCDLYLFLETDCEYVQDGTRLSIVNRELLSKCHRKQLSNAGITLIVLTGNWRKRTSDAITIIESSFPFINQFSK